MFFFRDENSKDLLFEAVFLVERTDKGISGFNMVFPETDTFLTHIKEQVKRLSFPLVEDQGITWDPEMTVNLIPSENIHYYLYTKYYTQQTKFIAVAILSRYHHFRLFKSLFSTITSQIPKTFYQDSSKIEFEKTTYEIRPKKQVNDLNLNMDVSPLSEIAYLQSYFLANYPPTIIGSLMPLVCAGCRIFVVSSNTTKITQTVFAIASFFYPIVANDVFYPLIAHQNISTLSKLHEGVIGIHSLTFLAIQDRILQADIIFNLDDVYISSGQPPKFKSWLNVQISEFAQTVRNVTKNYEPAFPAYNIRCLITDFFTNFLAKILNTTKVTETIMIELKRYSGSGSNLENYVAKSPIIKQLYRLTREKNKQVQDLIWDLPIDVSSYQRNLVQKNEETPKAGMPQTRDPQRRGKSFISFRKK